jgi:Flp pilus assembly protein TadG
VKRESKRTPSLRAKDQSAAALVEFALILPILLLLLLGMVDFGKSYNYWIDETHLASEGSRYAEVNKNPSQVAGQSLQTYIQQQADTSELRSGGTAAIPSAAQVCISFPNGTSNVGDPVKVEVATTYHFLPFLGGKHDVGIFHWNLVPSKTISASSTMRLEAPPTNYVAGCS